MALEDLKSQIYHCSKCGACRVAYRQSLPTCPAGEKFGFESYFSIGRTAIARAILEGDLDWNEKVRDRVYNCTLCGACDAHCYAAMGLHPVQTYLEMRRELVKRGLGPMPQAVPMIDSMKNYDNPLMANNKDRPKWYKKAKEKKIQPGQEVLFFVGCALEFDPTAQPLAKATASLLEKAGVDWGMLNEDEVCCGFPALELGAEDEFARLAKKNVEQINALGVKTIVTACAGCQMAMKKEWPRYGELNAEVLHITEYSLRLIKEGKLKITGEFKKKVAYHDPCTLGRYTGVYDEPREVLKMIPGLELVEMEREREEAWCCGAGGGQVLCQPEWSAETATSRLEEAINAGAEVLAVGSCPTCMMNFDMAIHGYANMAKIYGKVLEKAPVAMKFLGAAQKLSSPFMKRRKTVDIEIIDTSELLDKVT